jgi:hypothetical protein
MDPFLWIDNQRSAQSKFIEEPFNGVIRKFDLIIEIGTFTGVFTKWLSQNVKDGSLIFSYDNNPSYRIVEDLSNVRFRVCDFFNLETLSEIKSLIQTSGRTLILCDGGDKETEFKILSRFMKDGDVIMLHDYEHDPLEYHAISESIGWLTNSESFFRNLERYLPELNLIPYKYEEFKDVLWGSFTKKSNEIIALSITTSRRLPLFKTTIETLSRNCKDKHLIKYFLHFDDSSSNGDRDEMESIIRKKFPLARIYNFRFGADTISDKKRHREIMGKWKSEVEDMCDFVFHTEDDWRFDKEFYLSEIISFIKRKEDVAYVGVSQEIRDFPEDMKPKTDGIFWEWYFDKEKEILSNLFLDSKIMAKSGDPGFWCYYINWPYFGFRPGVWDTKRLSEFDWSRIYTDNDSHFELDFAKGLSEKYVSYSMMDSVCEHIGTEESAYDINNSSR